MFFNAIYVFVFEWLGITRDARLSLGILFSAVLKIGRNEIPNILNQPKEWSNSARQAWNSFKNKYTIFLLVLSFLTQSTNLTNPVALVSSFWWHLLPFRILSPLFCVFVCLFFLEELILKMLNRLMNDCKGNKNMWFVARFGTTCTT